jgi:hypothetical protein
MPEYNPPELVFGPAIRTACRPLGDAILKESGASKVIVTCTYELAAGKDKLTIKMAVSTDNCMERTDAKPPLPKGDKLSSEAEESVRNALNNKPEGGEHV